MPDTTQNTPDSLTLVLKEFGVSAAEKIILGSISLDIPDKEVTCLIGPSGTGKSTLLRTLAGHNSTNPNMHTWGSATYCGAPLGESDRYPRLVMQSTRLLMSSLQENLIHDLPERSSLNIAQQRDLSTRMLQEAGIAQYSDHLSKPVIDLPLAIQRLVAIIRLCATGTRLLCLDEPTANLDESDSDLIIRYIQKQKKRRAILITLHNLAQAQRLGGQTALLAGGNIQEVAPSDHFFNQPETPPAKQFVRTGSCATPSPDAKPEELAPGVKPPPPLPKEARKYLSDSFGPRGFLWLLPGLLAGTPMPGIFFEADYDLKALHRVGVRHLISLMETPPATETNASHGITTSWFSVIDMEAPNLEQARQICEHIDQCLQEEKPTAVHCRAGMGRTGTIMAAYLIWQGKHALTALEEARAIEPRWVQSQIQVSFLEEFETFLKSIKTKSKLT
ncbi:MAG: ATP-binding cassette domain-containing protein [Oceanobacter sp.]